MKKCQRPLGTISFLNDCRCFMTIITEKVDENQVTRYVFKMNIFFHMKIIRKFV